MKSILQLTATVIALTFAVSSVFGQEKTKKVQTFKVSKVIPFSAEQVWGVVGEDYGKIADSHPKIVYSEYMNGSLMGEEGAERVCNFNQKGTQFLHERIQDWNPQEMSFTNTVFHAGKFPVDPAYTKAIYKVEAIDANSSRLIFDMQFRTKPGFMGGMMKNNFNKLINDYFIAIEHHLSTGEKVSADNFKTIKKQYASR